MCRGRQSETCDGIHSYDSFVHVYANRPKRHLRTSAAQNHDIFTCITPFPPLPNRQALLIFSSMTKSTKRLMSFNRLRPTPTSDIPLRREVGGARTAQGCCRCWTSTRRSACQAGCSVRAVGVRRRPVLFVR